MKFRNERQSSMRQKARVLHEPSHKVALCDADRNCKISTFTWNEPTQLWSYAVDYEILVMHLFEYNTRGKRVSNFFWIPWNYLTESKNLTSRFSRFGKIICIMIMKIATKFINKSYAQSKRNISCKYIYSFIRGYSFIFDVKIQIKLKLSRIRGKAARA